MNTVKECLDRLKKACEEFIEIAKIIHRSSDDAAEKKRKLRFTILKLREVTDEVCLDTKKILYEELDADKMFVREEKRRIEIMLKLPLEERIARANEILASQTPKEEEMRRRLFKKENT